MDSGWIVSNSILRSSGEGYNKEVKFLISDKRGCYGNLVYMFKPVANNAGYTRVLKLFEQRFLDNEVFRQLSVAVNLRDMYMPCDVQQTSAQLLNIVLYKTYAGETIASD